MANNVPTLGAPKAAKTDSGDATVQKVNAEADNVHALLLDGNVTLMFAAIAGLGNSLHFHKDVKCTHYFCLCAGTNLVVPV